MISFFFSSGGPEIKFVLKEAADHNNWNPSVLEMKKREITKKGYINFPYSGYDDMFLIKNATLSAKEKKEILLWENTSPGDAKTIKRNFLSLNRSLSSNKLLAATIAEKVAKQLD
jgi:hypothetical protein